MIGYFPHPYKDESIYSIVARYHYHMGNKSKYHTLEELFSKTVSLNTEYINNLDQLSSKINHFSNQPGYELLINHTTVPLYYPFNKTTLLTNNPFLLPSIYRYKKRHNDIKPKENLHFCTDCLNEQIEELGEGYWNRWHQIPGVFVCLKHKIPLLKHQMNVERFKINGFVLPDNDSSNQSSTLYKLDDLEKHLALAEDVKFLVNYRACFLEQALYKKYLTIIKIKGIAYPMSQMLKNLSDLLLTTYGNEFLNYMDSNLKDDNWINRLFHEKKLFDIHPIRHILLMRALSGSVESFIHNSDQFEPFGEGPWVCMNPLCDHYLKEVVTKVEVSVHPFNRKIQGDFICNCGFVYRLRQGEFDPCKVPYFSSRVMKKGHVWERNFYKMVNQGLKMNELEEKTKLSRPTIRKILREGIDPIQNAIQKRDKKTKEWRKRKTATYRRVWINAVNNNPNHTRSELANHNRATFAWLHQFDSEWLEENSPVSQKGHRRKEKEDFEEKDLFMVKEVQRINDEWKQHEKVVGKIIRKTFSAICDLLGSNRERKVP
ncbi:TnsD family Tn7-like transposition protein [Paraliobacillus zengyii]|uniref:TnsD family Tn7-like transposition protein n=1 Tax=Paraliobacillus zengyii TaxID=2213194 RepID=UPI000E3C9D0A|nr:TnsD family Tn7-like transposition protein [Paraliobacillus zengyii]